MKTREIILYLISVLIWGSTWLVIKFQLGLIHPAVSVGYRFLLSGLLLCSITHFILKKSLRLTRAQHLMIAAQSLFLYCINYLCLYNAEQWLPSGVVSVLFSMMLIFNALGGSHFFQEKLHGRFWMGALCGIAGIALIFSGEFKDFHLEGHKTVAIILALFGTLSASIGNLLSKKLFTEGVDIFPVTGIGMLYGAAYTLVGCLIMGLPFQFDSSTHYLLSMLYLSLFGSIVAFVCYNTLLRNIGAARCGYMTIITPIVALTLSSFFEGMVWTFSIIFGVILCVIGSSLVLLKEK